MERKMGEGWAEGQGRLQEADRRAAELDGKLAAKSAEVSTYQDMLEQSQAQFIILEKKYNKAKKIIKGETITSSTLSIVSACYKTTLT